ncbi:putative metal-dependent hydrolase [Rubellimicrobium thermophilum DSM 16684]|uniref:Putative metal-dependent hydrolase n=1 Tax=Rubellimicrobium thermophilum DSM 16684 TaxID=1123069 RepID=S9S379_9RHOB|nr:putative metal-dependent hydrolase [Rubellimicrobium thermophilum DSM 16684]
MALRRSARARRLSLRVSALDGRATLTLPARASLTEALAFLHRREDWLRRHAAAAPAPLWPAFGSTIPFEGSPLLLRPGPVLRHEGGTLWLPPDPERLPARLGAFLRAAARDRLAAACDRHAPDARAALPQLGAARSPLALGVLLGRRGSDVFLAARPRPTRGARLCRRA